MDPTVVKPGDPSMSEVNTTRHVLVDTQATTDAYLSQEVSMGNNATTPSLLITALTLRGVEGLLAVAGNLLTVVAIFRFRRLRTTSNVFIANLAVVDIMSGISAIFYILINIQISESSWVVLCHALNVIKTFADSGTLKAILLIGLERFVYINYPMSYYRIFTRGRVILALIVSWIIAVGMYMLRLGYLVQVTTSDLTKSGCVIWNLLPPEVTLANCGLVWLQIVLLIAFYSFIFNLARRKIRKNPGVVEAHETKHFRSGLRVLRMAFTVLGLFTLLTVPGLIVVMLTALKLTDPADYRAIKLGVSLMWYLNSTVNPVIYAWQSRDFRRAFGTLLGVEKKPMGYNSKGSNTHIPGNVNGVWPRVKASLWEAGSSLQLSTSVWPGLGWRLLGPFC